MPYQKNEEDEDDKSLTPEEKKHHEIKERWECAKEYWQKQHSNYVEDIRFGVIGDQWDPKVKRARQQAGQSCLVYNLFQPLYKYIINNARANTPAVKVSPLSNGANTNTARVFDGIVKSIYYRSKSKQAHINALKCAVIGGIGAWKILPVETSEGEYEIRTQRISDPTTVYFDPNALDQDYADAEYVFEEIWIDEEQFKSQWPGASPEIHEGKNKASKQVRLLSYWCKSSSGGVEHHILTESELLVSDTDYKGKHLPIILVTGEEVDVEGEREFYGIVRGNKDKQTYHNLAKSKEADVVALAPNAQWLAEAKQIKGYEKYWLESNVNGVPILPYNAVDGRPPQRLDAPNPPATFMQASQTSADDMRSSVGIRDPLKDIPATQSGKALKLQIAQSDIGTFEYIDRLKDAMLREAEVIIDLIPHVYNYPHVREVIGFDNQTTAVPIRQAYEDNGEVVMHDLAKGKYSVILKEGPDYESQRSEASDKLMDLVAKYPEFMQLAGDILFRNFDFEGAEEIADRLRSKIPPEVLAASNPTQGDKSSQIGYLQNTNNQMQMQLQQMQAQLQQLQAQNQQLTNVIETRVTEVNAKRDADVVVENVKFEHAKSLKLLDIEGKIKNTQQQGEERQQQIGAQAQADVVVHEATQPDVVPTPNQFLPQY